MAFDSKKINALQLKFNRHKLTFEYNSNENNLIIGKSKNTNQKLFIGISLIALAILIMAIIGYLQLPVGRILNFVIVGGIGVLGLKQLADYSSLKKNKETKIITKDFIKIGDTKFMKSDINKIDFDITTNDDGTSKGVLFLSVNNEEKTILTILDKGPKFVKNDLLFVQEIIQDFMS